jgi:hypothetical protein
MKARKLLLCANSVSSVSRWLIYAKPPQRNREHRGCTEKRAKLDYTFLRLFAAQTTKAVDGFFAMY